MKTRALGFLLMAIGACTYAVGCGSSNNNNGTGGAGGAGTGGKATGGVSGTGGVAGAGAGGKTDSGTDTSTDTKTDTGTDIGSTDTKADTATDTPVDIGNTDVPVGDTSGDTQGAPTFAQVYAILSDKSSDAAPNCSSCHDGIIADGGAVQLPHSMDFSTKAAAYTALFGVNSLRCAGGDGGVPDAGAFKRVLAGNAAMSVLWQKVNQFVNTTVLACDGVQMPLQKVVPVDAGGDAGAGVDSGVVAGTHHVISAQQVTLIQDWINAGALNN